MNMNLLKKLISLSLVVVMLASLSACFEKDDTINSVLENKPEETNDTQKEFNALMQDIFVYDVTGDIYTLATTVKDPANFSIEVPEDISYDSLKLEYTDEELAENKKKVAEFVSRFEAIDYDELSQYQQFVYGKIEAELELAELSYEVNDLASPVAINNSWISSVQIGLYEFIFDDETDIKDYQKLLETIPGIMEMIPDHIQMQIDEYNLIPSDYMIEGTVETLTDLQDVKDNPLIDGYNSKIDALELEDSKAEDYKAANEKYVTETLIPAFAVLQTEIETFKGSCEEPLGIYYAEGGEEYYNYLIKSYGFDMDVDEMYEYLYDKFHVVFNAQMKLVANDYSSAMDYYNGDYDLDVPEEPDEMMERLLDEFSGEFPALKNVGYELSYLPKSLEIEGMLAYCVLNRLDDADAATCIRVNKSQVAGDTKTLYTTLAHEGYPGHMLHSNYYYNAIQYPVEGTLGYLGYVEGWARYVDNKAYYKMGVDKGLADFCQTDNDLGYTLSGLLDVAINGLGYDAEQVNNLMSDLVGSSDLEYARTLVESFSADPGIYLPYSAGYWHTVDLINEYKDVCGSSMSRSEMFEKYMSLGPAPFSVLEEYLLEEK